MTNKELKRLDILIGFANDICEIVSDPEEHLSPNSKDTSVLSIGYYQDKNNETIIVPFEEGDSIKDLKDVLQEITYLVKTHSKVDFTEQWKESK